MKTTTSKNQYNKSPFIAVLFVIFCSSLSSAQHQSSSFYRGFECSFGTRSFTVSSNVPELNNLAVVDAGGQLGIVFGSRAIRTKVGLAGFYYSSANTKRTVDLYEADLSTNIYPLSMLNVRKKRTLEPYVTTGVVYDRIKFFGHFMEKDPGRINHSAEEPMIGVINQMRLSAGTGVVLKLINQYDFVHLFGEVKYNFNMGASANSAALSKTSVSDQLMINVGVRFGAFR